jgi:hypothetical protein
MTELELQKQVLRAQGEKALLQAVMISALHAIKHAINGRSKLSAEEMVDGIIKSLGPARPLTHRHRKRGTLYQEIGRGELQVSESLVSDGTELVVYQGEDGKLWFRPVDEFDDPNRFDRLSV